ncbi:hypothetical protein [Deefgea rivuli]|uniref:hypothetical protein n=1 Tax=Deefgea rivuli TaxID=400948 RepID=UPI000484F007|nr:hypothetical protein [Deefgea rivuli]
MSFTFRELNQNEVERLKKAGLSYANDIGLVCDYDLDGANVAAVDTERELIAINVTRITAAHDDNKVKVCALLYGESIAYVWYYENQNTNKDGDSWSFQFLFSFKKILPVDLTDSKTKEIFSYLKDSFFCDKKRFTEYCMKVDPEMKEVKFSCLFEGFDK